MADLHRLTNPSAAKPTPVPTLRSLAPSAFLPAMVYEIGNGSIAPIIVLTASDLGASPGKAAFMLAMLGIGRVLGDVPASSLAEKIGDRRSMIVAATLAAFAFFVCLLSPSLLIFGAALILIGVSNAAFYLARQSYLIDVVPVELRARAMSTLGGSHRIGLFIGPFVGAAAISLVGLRGGYVVAIISAAAAGLLLIVIPDIEVPDEQPSATRSSTGAYGTLVAHLRMFATLGIAIIAVGAVRAARQTVLPLWAEHLGLSPEMTSLIFGIASSVDMALFYPAGKVMDQFGRLAIALPATLIMGGAMMALPLSRSALSLTVIAMAMSLGNGIGSGIMMTLGADAAPIDGRVRFLGVWRLLSDAGNAGGPVVVSVVATAWTLAAGIVAIGSVGLLATVALAKWVPRYSPYATPSSVRRHRAG
jgi:MFS family permease